MVYVSLIFPPQKKNDEIPAFCMVNATSPSPADRKAPWRCEALQACHCLSDIQ